MGHAVAVLRPAADHQPGALALAVALEQPEGPGDGRGQTAREQGARKSENGGARRARGAHELQTDEKKSKHAGQRQRGGNDGRERERLKEYKRNRECTRWKREMKSKSEREKEREKPVYKKKEKATMPVQQSRRCE